MLFALNRDNRNPVSFCSSYIIVLMYCMYTFKYAFSKLVKLVLTCGGNEGWNRLQRHQKKHCLLKKVSVTRFSTSGFFVNQFPPGPWVYCTIKPVKIFFYSRRNSQLKVHHRYRCHRWQWKISAVRKVLIILFEYLWVVQLTYR